MRDSDRPTTAEYGTCDVLHRSVDRPSARNQISSPSTVRLVAFDLDGTLLRGDTVCQAIARRMGHLARMNEIEQLQERAAIAAARVELAGYYQSISHDELVAHVAGCQLAPGVQEGLALLRVHGLVTAVVSITWTFAVAWFAQQFGVDYWIGTGLTAAGDVTHFWPEDKSIWLANLMRELKLCPAQVAAVGDSTGDVAMLTAVAHGFYVGRELPADLAVNHRPDGNILSIAQEIIALT